MGGKAQPSVCPLFLKSTLSLACLGAILFLPAATPVLAQSIKTESAPVSSSAPVVLDRVVAVVNNQAILDSDIDDEIRLSVLDPGRIGQGVLTRARALNELIARALIQQQIRQEDLQSAEPPQDEVDARLLEIRRQLPACIRNQCSTEEGWKNFLAIHNLTQDRVEAYLHYRLQILRFIEQRFRQGIGIQPQEIEAYYRNTLLPQYAKGEAVPPLAEVSKRIEEILLQQRVNILFDDWLDNLRKQGNIEVLDPTIEDEAPAPGTQAAPAEQGGPATVSPDASPDGRGKVSP